ncbi:hypothetical protein BC832DRAFT_556331 [Gaertneriomyces semiglobifer]|nr:hypothetical protein BC832DRAFT_556331 [Gaertneriomyces semiglobifer]
MNANDHWGHECERCDSTFRTWDAAVAHMNQTGHWRFFCMPCNRKFTGQNQLNQHLNSRIHRGATVSCPFCKKAYTTASGLSHHLESSSCPKARQLDRDSIHRMIGQRDTTSLITRPQLEYHTTQYNVSENCWNGYAYECYLCHDVFGTLKALDTHVNKGRHRQKIYHCPLQRTCGKEFVALAALFNHLESESCGYARFEQVNQAVNRFFDASRSIGF